MAFSIGGFIKKNNKLLGIIFGGTNLLSYQVI